MADSDFNHSKAARETLRLPRAQGKVEPQTPEQIYERLLRALHFCDAQLEICRDSVQRRKLGLEKAELNMQIHAIRPKRKCPEAVNYFIAAAKSLLDPHLFDALMAQARQRKTVADAQPNPADARQVLVDQWNHLHDKIVLLEKGSGPRRQLGLQIANVEKKLQGMPATNTAHSLDQHFINAVRPEMAIPVYIEIMEEAVRLAKAATAAKAPIAKAGL